MRICIAVDAPPLPFRALPSHEELNAHDKSREQADANKLNHSPLFPERVTHQPEYYESERPKPGIASMCKEDSHSAQCAWLFGHAHLIGKPGVQIKDG